MKKLALLIKIIPVKQIAFAALFAFSPSVFAQDQITANAFPLVQYETETDMLTTSVATTSTEIITPRVKPDPGFLKNAMSKLKKSISDSVLDFNDDNNGNIYISIEGKLLFSPGSAVVDLKGKKGIRTLALLLYNAQKEFSMMIKGNSDILALKKLKYDNSWSLSQTRAASLMHILTEPVREALQEKASMLEKSAKKKNVVMVPKNIHEESIKNADKAITNKYVFILVNSL